ncbi:MAG: hypothetical protein LBT73_00760 [Tannerellaceae bacterium]|nr:hypothetical protein [Tannerellaceae bacterium]
MELEPIDHVIIILSIFTASIWAFYGWLHTKAGDRWLDKLDDGYYDNINNKSL